MHWIIIWTNLKISDLLYEFVLLIVIFVDAYFKVEI